MVNGSDEPVEEATPMVEKALPAKPAITQASLRRYLRLKKELRELQPWIRQVKRALAEGVAVENGPCTIEARKASIPVRVAKWVVEGLGLTPEQIADLLKGREAKKGMSLVVREYGEAYPFDG